MLASQLRTLGLYSISQLFRAGDYLPRSAREVVDMPLWLPTVVSGPDVRRGAAGPGQGGGLAPLMDPIRQLQLRRRLAEFS